MSPALVWSNRYCMSQLPVSASDQSLDDSILGIFSSFNNHNLQYTVEPLMSGHPDKRPIPPEKSMVNVYLKIDVLIFTPDERPPLLKNHLSGAKEVTLQEGFHCNNNNVHWLENMLPSGNCPY